MKTLFRKELGTLMPFLFLALFLSAADIVYVAFTEFPDMYGIPEIVLGDETEDDGNAAEMFVYFVIAFSLGLGLIVREKDEGTLEFLDSLPISRSRVFWAKIIMANAVLLTIPITGNGLIIAFHALSRTSLEPSFHFLTFLKEIFVECVALWVYLGMGLGLSFFRRFAFLIFGILILAYLALDHFGAPWIAQLNPWTIADYTFSGQDVIIPWNHLGILSAIGLLGYVVAWVTFLVQGDPLARVAGVLDRWRIKGLVIGAGSIAIFALWAGIGIYAIYQIVEEEDGTNGFDESVIYPSWETARMRTEHFEFIYPQNLQRRARSLAGRSEKVHENVIRFLDAEPTGETVIDMTGPSQHYAGLAFWKKIKLDITRTDSVDELSAILGHEIVHVYIDFMSDSKLSDSFNSTRWFHEGLASYLEFRLFRKPEEVVAIRRVAAVAYQRDAAAFETLVQSDELSRTFDTYLVYALGEAFVSALVANYGDDAPGKIIRAFDRKDAPKDLEGMTLWRDVFQACGYSLPAVVDKYYSVLKQTAEAESAFIESLPRISGQLHQDDTFVGIEPIFDGELPADTKIVCAFRRAADTPDIEVVSATADDDGIFWVERSRFPSNRWWYQLGISTRETSMPLRENWQEVRIR